MTFIDDPDEDGTHECQKCKGLGTYSGTVRCPYCDGNENGIRRVCKVLIRIERLDCVCEGTYYPSGRCILCDATCLHDEVDFWTDIDCKCEKGRFYQQYIQCSQCKGEGRLDWIQRVTSKARDEEE
jgi:hypothetical protein